MNSDQSETTSEATAAATWGTWAILSGADSVLSEIFHRYHSRLPEAVIRDVEAAYTDCRKESERIKAELRGCSN